MPTVTRRGRKRSTKASKTKSTKKQRSVIRQTVLDKICADLDELTKKNNGWKPHKAVWTIVEETKVDCPWITRHIVNYAFKKHLEKKDAADLLEKQGDSIALEMEESAVDRSSVALNKGGRPTGTTDYNKMKQDVAIRLAMDDMAVEFDLKRKAAKRLNLRLKVGTLYGIINKF